MNIEEVKLYLIRIPFRFSFRHAGAQRNETTNLIAEVKLDNGIKGYGEGIPREYVTGETAEDTFSSLEKTLSARLKQILFVEKSAFLKTLDNALEGLPQSGRCAVEIACLDAFTRHHRLPLYRLFASACNNPGVSRYSAVMSAEGTLKTCLTSLFFRVYGFKDIKLKVGFENDMDRLRLLRCVVGKSADIRMDANGAWNSSEAIEKLAQMSRFRPSLVEQPVPADDLEGFRKVTEESGILTMADESVRTPEEAEKFAREKICRSFNIRLSKCGGFINSIKIAGIAERYGLNFQIGCHVGETGILSAAGRHLAICLPESLYLEGSYSRFLLRGDIVRGGVGFGRGGVAKALDSQGLGVEIEKERFAEYIFKSKILRN